MPAKNNNQKAKQRFVDQPGQWEDVTPKAVKDRQKKAWDKLLNGEKKSAKKGK